MASTTSQQSLCFPLDKAITKIPLFMQGNDDSEKDELAIFFNMVDQLHKPGENVSARKILNYLDQLFLAETEEVSSKNSVAQDFDELFDITGKIATEIVYKVMNGGESHNITTEVLNILQQYSWETKVGLAITTYLLTFGDSGLNLCLTSKVSIKELPVLSKHMLDIMNCIVEFEKLPITYMTSEDEDIKDARTQLIVAIYWIIRAIVAASASNILIISSRWGELGINSSPISSSVQKLEAITTHFPEILHKLEKLQEDEIDMEAYEKFKEIMHEQDHDDNMIVLNALFSVTDYDAPKLYKDFAQKSVQIDELKGKNVLLLISSLDINPYEFDTIKMIYDEPPNKEFEYEMVWIPIVDRSLKSRVDTNSLFEKLRTSIPWYNVYHPSMIKNAIKKFLIDDWKFERESMIVVLDPQGNVVNHNAMHMMLIWHSNAVPFTLIREKMLLEQKTWNLNLLINGVDELVENWIENKECIFMYGGVDMEWIRSVTSMVNKVSQEWKEPIKMVYVGENDYYKANLVEKVSSDIKNEKLSHCLSKYSMWHFWRRKNAVINLMVQHEISGKIKLSEMLLFDKHTKSKVGWAIFAEGSKIAVNGDGKVVLATLGDLNYQTKREKSSSDLGLLGMNFAREYTKLYMKEFPIQCLHQLPPTSSSSINNKVPENVRCPDCGSQMQNTTTFVCNHPSTIVYYREYVADGKAKGWILKEE